ncbi:glutamate receptor ionotropic, delta-1 [Caerostris darwini]|uniref:Glutamate receptor ionotropic, delta-1 n=1 Tax=Caerostris darwini TaxID=1538125 RepID=A0AAV4R991_9ARAC|nr:glutamate receptor ionotropic, delta-1 [Caerostris darwini]
MKEFNFVHNRMKSFIDITPIFQMGKRADGSFYGKGGTDYSILQILSEHVPFSYDLINRQDYVFGNIDDKGEWTGMMGMLKKT